MAEEMMRVTLAIVGRRCSVKMSKAKPRISASPIRRSRHVRHADASVLASYPGASLPKVLRAKRAMKFLDRTIYDMVARAAKERRR